MKYAHFDSADLAKNALPAALGCLFFPIPLIVCPRSRLGRFCANEGLALLIAFIALKIVFWLLNLLLGWLPLVGTLVAFAGWLAMAAVTVAAFYLAWQTWKQQPVYLPIVGDFNIFR